MFNLMLRTKIMSAAIGIVVILMVLSTVIVSFIIYGQNRDVSTKFLDQSMSLVKNETSLINKRLLSNAKQMTTRADIGGSIKYIQSFGSMESLKTQTEKSYREITKDIFDVSLTASIWKAAVYDENKTLMAYSVIEGNNAKLGYPMDSGYKQASIKTGEAVTDESWQQTSTIDQFETTFPGDMPTKETVHFEKTGKYISMVCYIPVIAEVYDEGKDAMVNKEVGFVMAIDNLDNDFTNRLSMLTHTKIDVFSDQGFSVGVLPEYKTIDLKSIAKLSGQKTADKTQEIILNDATVAGEDYFQAILPVTGDSGVIGAIVSLYSTSEAMSNTWAIVRILVIISIICIVLILPFSYFFAVSVTKPLKGMSQTLVEVADSGNFNQRVKNTAKDEVGMTAEAFNTLMDSLQIAIGAINEIMAAMAGGNLTKSMDGAFKGELRNLQESTNESISKLSLTINEVLTSFEQVEVGANELSNSSRTLANGTTQQAATLEEIASAMNEISVQAKTNNDNANEAAGITSQAIENGQNGKRQMDSMLQSMKEINETSTEVTKIIKVIDEIAFQTNLLALNAAVEAARAGKYGKGFAVVAEEVRNLAARSAEAARNTTDLIENSLKQVEKGVSNADKTAEILNEITTSIDKSNELVAKIADSSKEQDTGIKEINDGLSQVNTVIQQNSAIAEQSSAASDELLSHAARVKEMLNQFILSQTIESAKSVKVLDSSYDPEDEPKKLEM